MDRRVVLHRLIDKGSPAIAAKAKAMLDAIETAPIGGVYFVRAVGTPYVKIGFSAQDIGFRIGKLQSACPFELKLLHGIPSKRELETRLHRLLARRRHRGEWFKFASDEEVMEWIRNFLEQEKHETIEVDA